MFTHSYSPDDPRLTAYVVGELDAAERAEVEQLLASSPEARAAVAEIETIATQLFAALQTETQPKSPLLLTTKSDNRRTVAGASSVVVKPVASPHTAKSQTLGVASVVGVVLVLISLSFLNAPSVTPTPVTGVGRLADDGSYRLALSDYANAWHQEQQREWLLFLETLSPEEQQLLLDEVSQDGRELAELMTTDVPRPDDGVIVDGESQSLAKQRSTLASGPTQRFDLPSYAWPANAPSNNSAQITYPTQYSASANPYIGPFFPYAGVPHDWRPAQRIWVNEAPAVTAVPTLNLVGRDVWPTSTIVGLVSPPDNLSLDVSLGGNRNSIQPVDDYSNIVTHSFEGPVFFERRRELMNGAYPRFGEKHLSREQSAADQAQNVARLYYYRNAQRVQEIRNQKATSTGKPLSGQEGSGQHWTFRHQVLSADFERNEQLARNPTDKEVALLRMAKTPLTWQDGSWELRFDPNGDGGLTIPTGDAQGSESYRPITENDFIVPTGEAALSTFGLDVDTASYSNTRRFLNEGSLPPVDAVRLEELVNYFSYDNALPEAGEPFAVTREVAQCPWNPKHKLVRIGLKGREIPLEQRPLTRLVFLLDTSGSMQSANKLPLVQESMRLLTKQLGKNDRIAIVTYAGHAALKLDSTAGDDHETILAAINTLTAGGSTNGEGGIKLAYEIAKQHFIDNGTNRVILCTDGDFNVGVSDDGELVKLIEEKRETGVFLSILGFGMGNIKDAKLEGLADKGNGSYGYIDNIDEAKKIFVEELMGTLYTIAKDVKLQVEFNPQHVGAYRLLGYENRLLAAEDFNNDKIDAGELGAGHSVTALYEIIPPEEWHHRPFIDPLRYQELKVPDIEVGEKPTNQCLAERVASTLTAKKFQGYDIEIKVKDGNVELRVGEAVEGEAIRQAAEEAIRSVPGVRSVKSTLRVDGAQGSPVGLVEEMPRADKDELLLVKVRYKQPDGTESVKREYPLKNVVGPPSKSMQWATAVLGYGLLLRNSAHKEQTNWDLVLELANASKEDDRLSEKEIARREEFISLCNMAKVLWEKAHTPPRLPKLVQGVVTNVISKELVEINLGSKDGIAVGDSLTLALRDKEDKPLYVGVISIVSVEEGKSFGKALITQNSPKVEVEQLKGASVLKVTAPPNVHFW
ncbi:MAG: von Willebrand factor type A domain-containing protein [Planctomycetaceae bacterium]